MGSGFYNLENFEPKKVLEKNAIIISEEIKKIQINHMLPWHEAEIFTGGWFLQPILLTDISFNYTNSSIHKTIEILKSLNCIQAGISILTANTTIHPHSDNIYNDILLSSKTYRLQLGIDIPNNCSLTVYDVNNKPETQFWENGKILAFDSSRIHSAINQSKKNRIVLIADFKKNEIEISEEELFQLKMYYLNLYKISH